MSIARSSFYYGGTGESPLNLRLMRSIDAQFLETPFYGSRQMQRWLRRQGDTVSRKRVRRLLRVMGLRAVFQRPRTSQPHPGHRISPSLLRDLPITRPNHVWCTDVTDIPLQRGFLSLVAVMDWASRTVLAWRLSNTLEASFCVAALREALEGSGPPEIFNSDQGSHFTSGDFTDVLTEAGIRISMDGKGRWMANVFIERLWRRSSTSASTCPSSPLALRPGPASAGGWTSTPGAGPTHRSTVGRPKRRTLAAKLTEPGAPPLLRPAKRSLNHEPGFHLSCDEYLSEGWGPPLLNWNCSGTRRLYLTIPSSEL